ncbi:MAG: type II and III secretion system protein family protein [Pseudomonadota bacterium]
MARLIESAANALRRLATRPRATPPLTTGPRAAFLAAALAAAACLAAPAAVQAQGADMVRVIDATSPSEVTVAVNRAVVLEAGEPFAEVSVANPGIADVAALSNQSVYVLGKQPGRTTLTLLGAGGRLLTNISVRVQPDLQEFKARLTEILPGEPIEVRNAADGIVLSGTVSSAAQLGRAVELAQRYAPGRVTNMVGVAGTQQVLLRVRFAEVQRNAAKSLGFNWTVGAQFGNWGAQAQTGDFIGPGNPQSPVGPGGFESPYNPRSPSQGLMRLGFSAGGVVANLAIDALEGKGAARTLAEPNLVALSGDTASFLAGGEYPIPVSDSVTGSISVDYRPFGISLGFTPTVVEEDVINLQVVAESSAIDTSIVIQSAGVEYNGFSTRRANTTIELRDGQSFAIAGLLQETFVDSASQLPWIGDVPVLGTLFRSAEFQRNQTELVILVSAFLVNPASEGAYELPTDRIRLPNERELFLLGRVELEQDTGLRSAATRDFEGAFGYVVD